MIGITYPMFSWTLSRWEGLIWSRINFWCLLLLLILVSRFTVVCVLLACTTLLNILGLQILDFRPTSALETVRVEKTQCKQKAPKGIQRQKKGGPSSDGVNVPLKIFPLILPLDVLVSSQSLGNLVNGGRVCVWKSCGNVHVRVASDFPISMFPVGIQESDGKKWEIKLGVCYWMPWCGNL